MLPEGPGVVDMFCRILVAVDDDVISLDISRQACACRRQHTLTCNLYMQAGIRWQWTFVCNMYMQSGMRWLHTFMCNMYMQTGMRWHQTFVCNMCNMCMQPGMSWHELASEHCPCLRLMAAFTFNTVHGVAT